MVEPGLTALAKLTCDNRRSNLVQTLFKPPSNLLQTSFKPLSNIYIKPLPNFCQTFNSRPYDSDRTCGDVVAESLKAARGQSRRRPVTCRPRPSGPPGPPLWLMVGSTVQLDPESRPPLAFRDFQRLKLKRDVPLSNVAFKPPGPVRTPSMVDGGVRIVQFDPGYAQLTPHLRSTIETRTR